MQISRPKSEAETALLALFGSIGETLPGDDKVEIARAEAIAALDEFGLPTRRIEAWHYTDLRKMMGTAHQPAARASMAAAKHAIDNRTWHDGVFMLPLVNGHFMSKLVAELPEELIVSALCDGESAFIDGSLDADNAINILNTAFATDGLSMIVDEDASPDLTVGIAHLFTCDKAAMATTRNNIVVCDGASAKFSERFIGPDGIDYHSNAVTNLWLGLNSKARWVICQEEGDQALHLGQLNVTLGESAELDIFVVNTGSRLVRREINVIAAGERSNLNIRGVNVVGDKSHVDVTTVLHHNVPNTKSSQIFRNVSMEQGTGVFQGQIRVAQIAQKTDAAMACNTLLLSDDCSFSAKPELEIFADDVLCAHGATIADLEEAHLFYLMARGIPEREARNLLVKAFLEEVLEDLDDDAFREILVHRIDRWLDARQ